MKEVVCNALGAVPRKDRLLLSVIIVSFNTRDLTLAALASLIGQVGEDSEIIVVDNASSDDSAAAIGNSMPDVTLLALQENVGFAKANNLAAERARGKYLLLLNSDTVVQPGSIAALLAFAHRRPEARIWGGRSLNAAGNLDPRSCSRRPGLWSVVTDALGLAHFFPSSPLFNAEAMPGWMRDDERPVDVVIGCFLLIGRDDWRTLGGFDPAYFMYGEDVDLCLRAHRLGARPAICPKALFIHHSGASQNAAPRMMQVLAGRVRTCRRHLPVWQQGLAVWAIRAGVLMRLGAYSLRSASSVGRQRLQHVFRHRQFWWQGYPDKF